MNADLVYLMIIPEVQVFFIGRLINQQPKRRKQKRKPKKQNAVKTNAKTKTVAKQKNNKSKEKIK